MASDQKVSSSPNLPFNRMLALFVAGSYIGAFAQGQSQPGERPRRAFLLVNSAYSKLTGLVPDASGAAALAEALRAANFEVVVRSNLDLNATLEALDGYSDGVKEGDVSFFYYSGFMLQKGNENYI